MIRGAPDRPLCAVNTLWMSSIRHRLASARAEGGSAAPVVVAAARDLQEPAHQHNRMRLLMTSNHGVPHLDCLAKYGRRFSLGKRFSSSTRANSRLQSGQLGVLKLLFLGRQTFQTPPLPPAVDLTFRQSQIPCCNCHTVFLGTLEGLFLEFRDCTYCGSSSRSASFSLVHLESRVYSLNQVSGESGQDQSESVEWIESEVKSIGALKFGLTGRRH